MILEVLLAFSSCGAQCFVNILHTFYYIRWIIYSLYVPFNLQLCRKSLQITSFMSAVYIIRTYLFRTFDSLTLTLFFIRTFTNSLNNNPTKRLVSCGEGKFECHIADFIMPDYMNISNQIGDNGGLCSIFFLLG